MRANRALLLALLGGFALAACGVNDTDSGERPTAVEGYPRTVATFEGRTLTLTRPPERVLPANGATLEILADLDLLERVVAIPSPAFDYASIELHRDEWKNRTFDSYLVEPMLAFRPDLVLTNSWQNPETSGFLAQNGIAVLDVPPARSLEDLLDAIRIVADLLEVGSRAQALCTELRERHAALQVPARAGLRAMTYTTYGTGGSTAAGETTGDLLIGFAGMHNASTEHGLKGHAPIDMEVLLTIDPDYVIVSASETDPTRSTTLEAIRNEPALAKLRALQEDRVIVLPLKYFTANSHYLVEAAEALAERIDRHGD